MKRLKFTMGALLIPLICIAAPLNEEASSFGTWGRASESLYQGLEPRSKGVVAPDALSTVYSTHDGLFIRTSDGEVTLPVVLTPGLAEAVWAPTSKFVALTVSDGGVVGTWDTYLVPTGDPSNLFSVRGIVTNAAKDIFKCNGEILNIGAIGWDKHSDIVKVIAEVPPHSTCEDMGKIEGLVINVRTRTVQRRLNRKEVLEQWRDILGRRFMILPPHSRTQPDA